MNTPGSHTGMVMVALAAATWGTIGVTVDLLYRVTVTDALSVGFWRTALSAPLLLALNHFYSGASPWRVARRDLLPLFIMGLSFAAYQVCYFAAIRYIGVAAAALINICSAPLIIALLSGMFLQERVVAVVYAVLAVAVAGAVLLVGGSPAGAALSACAADRLGLHPRHNPAASLRPGQRPGRGLLGDRLAVAALPGAGAHRPGLHLLLAGDAAHAGYRSRRRRAAGAADLGCAGGDGAWGAAVADGRAGRGAADPQHWVLVLATVTQQTHSGTMRTACHAEGRRPEASRPTSEGLFGLQRESLRPPAPLRGVRASG